MLTEAVNGDDEDDDVDIIIYRDQSFSVKQKKVMKQGINQPE